MVELIRGGLGVVLLVSGAEFLVRGASRLALRLGVTPLVVGLTVVAVGTGAPEITTGLVAAVSGHPDLAVGNLIGSNIANVLLVLGLVSMLSPLSVAQRLVRLDVPLLIAVSAMVLLMALDGRIGGGDGALLLLAFVGYVAFCVYETRYEEASVASEYEEEFGAVTTAAGPGRDLFLTVVGIALLAWGSTWVVASATFLAERLGVSELIIGLTVVAVGTSLPEIVTSLVAITRSEPDIAVGNAIGSNLFNLLLALGLLGVVAPGGAPVAPGALRFDMPVMLAAAVACLPIFATGYRIRRWEGFVLLGYYIAYVAFLFLEAQQHAALPAYSRVMLGFVIPLTALTLLVTIRRSWVRRDG